MNTLPDSRFPLPAQPTSSRSTRAIGAGVALLCLLLLAGLLTYHVQEMGWSALNPSGHEKAGEFPCTNLLGPVGMYLAGILYYLLGAAAVYGALLAIVPAVGMVVWPAGKRTGQWISLAVMLVSACAILSTQSWLLVQWAERLSLTTPGGKLGYLLGTCVYEALIGKYWALSLLLLVHAAALIYFARLTPKAIYLVEKKDISEAWKRWRENRRLAREEKAAAARAWEQPFNREAALAEARQSTLPLPVNEPLPPQDPLPPARRIIPTPEPVSEPLPPREPVVTPRPPQPVRRPTPPPPAPEEEDEDTDFAPPPSAPAPAVTRPPLSPRPAAPARPTDNLLDLLPPAEDEDYPRPRRDEVEEERPISRKEAIIRHFDGEPAAVPTHRPEPRPIPRPLPERPAPRPAATPRPEPPAPRPAPRPAPAAADDSDYPMPPYELLDFKPVPPSVREAAQVEMVETQAIITDTLESFRISVEPGEITRGPSITRYEFSVPRGQKVQAIAKYRNDLMATTRSTSVNILAPIPGKSTVGVELENTVKEAVYLRELLLSPEFHNPKVRIPVALGKNVYGTPVIGDLAAMPHVIVAGTTGSGKSVCINSMLVSMLYKFKPDELKLILVDPKQVEMTPYKKLPHLAVPVVTDPARVIGALRWAVNEMERRYTYFGKVGVRNLKDFNSRDLNAPLPEVDDEPSFDEPAVNMRSADAIVRDIEDSQGYDIPEEDEDEQGQLDFEANSPIPDKLPYIVIVVDELADLMAQVKDDLELYISRLAAKARAAGIHMIVATQTPRSQVVTGIIKTNLPCRIALKVASLTDSRVILDESGAENLMGQGDLLFLPPEGATKIQRAQGAFVTDAEIQSIVNFCASHAKQSFVQSAAAEMSSTDSPAPGGAGGGGRGSSNEADEELYQRCVTLVVTERKASTTLLQRRFSIGYGKAARIMEMLEERGVVSPPTNSSRAREVLIDSIS